MDEAIDEHRHDTLAMFEREAWEERYRARPALWSGQPNAQLVAEAAALTPGRALDVGCGEGGDAIWLAERGWQVLGIDISSVALERAAAHTPARVASRIVWTQADLREQSPEESGYDLVTSHFVHMPRDPMWALYRAAAAAVAPGGTLLIVGHHPDDLLTTAGRSHFPDAMFTPADLLAALALAPSAWHIHAAEQRPRPAVDPEGRDITVYDTVVVARR